jgi:hypothetical protein
VLVQSSSDVVPGVVNGRSGGAPTAAGGAIAVGPEPFWALLAAVEMGQDEGARYAGLAVIGGDAPGGAGLVACADGR